MLCSVASPKPLYNVVDDAHHFFITICAASVSGGMGISMEKENITVNMEGLKELLENQEGEFILHVEIGGGKEDATEKTVQA